MLGAGWEQAGKIETNRPLGPNGSPEKTSTTVCWNPAGIWFGHIKYIDL